MVVKWAFWNDILWNAISQDAIFSNDAVLFTDKVCIDLDFECPSIIITVLFLKHKVKNDFHAVYDGSALA